MRARLWLLGLAAAVIGLPAPADEEGVVAAKPAAARPRPAAKAKTLPRMEMARLKQLAEAAEAAKAGAPAAPAPTGKDPAAKPEVANVFASTSWYVPPPPPKVEPPPKPTAPPLPFTFMGRYQDAKAASVVMLTKGDRLYTVTEGDVIDDTYRVDRIGDKAVELTYLPLQTKQSLPTGGA